MSGKLGHILRGLKNKVTACPERNNDPSQVHRRMAQYGSFYTLGAQKNGPIWEFLYIGVLMVGVLIIKARLSRVHIGPLDFWKLPYPQMERYRQ